jgi:hypothetical protein
MSKVALSNIAIDKLKVQKTTLFWDKMIPGFVLRVTPKGAKTLLFSTRTRTLAGRRRSGSGRGAPRGSRPIAGAPRSCVPMLMKAMTRSSSIRQRSRPIG